MATHILDELITNLKDAARDNQPLADFKVKPKHEPLMIDALLKLTEMVKKLDTRLAKIERDWNMAPGGTRGVIHLKK